MRLLHVAAVVACAMLILGCGQSHEVAGPNGAVIDGWPIGAELPDCTSQTFTLSCDEMIRAATTALDARDGPHAPVVSVKLYSEAPPVARTTGTTVAVFVLADGSRRALFVGSTPGGPITVDYGP